jgi:acyl transferase domain-containing protein
MSKQSCPLAIVGMSCLFPKADDLQAYWANIKNGVNAITPIPVGSHWNAADYFDADQKAPDHTYAQRGGFLSPVTFNPMEFGIAPKDIEATDTTQLLALVAAQRALADAGYATDAGKAAGSAAASGSQGRSFNRERTSVILGVTGALELVIPLGARLGHPHWRKALADAGVAGDVAEDVVQRISDSYVGWQENSFPGLLGNVAAGRIANRLDLGGTNCVVDAACGSSLAAIHLAGLELAAGLSDMVITGGVDTFNDIFMYMCFSKTPALSPTGDAKPFDRDCDGTMLGEGLGVLVLKRLADAERDGDRIYAVIKGMGTSSDGRSSAIYAPRAGGQKLALQRAYAAADVTPATLSLIEAHGTGTKVGDATELSALTEVFQAAQQQGSWCALGSVKSQIGHTKAAAGVAGIIKAAMALHQKVLPPTIKVTQPSDGAAPGRSPFYVNTRKRPWLPSAAHPRRAGVSALGFGGTNFHCVLEEHGAAKPSVDWDGDVEIIAFGSERADDLKAQLVAHRADASWPEFRRVAHDSRRQFQRAAGLRLLMVVTAQSDRAGLVDAALKMLDKNPGKASWTSPAGIAFGSGKIPGKLGALFPGQGSQYAGMLRDLACQFPGMMAALAEADAAFASDSLQTGAPGAGAQKLSDFIYPHPAFSDQARAQQEAALKDTQIAQPALGAVSMGALSVLHYFGVAADAACGHSYGELSALCGAGRIAPQALHQLSKLRGRLMASRSGSGDRGAMLAVQADEEAMLGFLREHNNDLGDLVVANRNSPKQTVLAGPVEQIKRAEAELGKRSIRSRMLQVSAAFHSALVADARAPFAAALAAVAFGKGTMPVYANSTGGEYPKTALEARELLANQIVRPVNFMQQIQAMHADGVRTFVEIGPGHVLCDLVQAIIPGGEVETIALDASRGARSGMFDLALALGRLASLGHEVDLSKWENAPAPAEAASGKPAFSIAISGANHRAPHASRPPAAPKPAPVQPLPSVQMVHSAAVAASLNARSAAAPLDRYVSPALAQMPAGFQVAGVAAADIPHALRAAQEGILALQRLQEQTAQLHQQFLEGQESARRAIQSLLSLRSGSAVQAAGPAPLAAAAAARHEPAVAAPPIQRPVAAVREHATTTTAPQPVAAPDRSMHERTVLEVVAEKTGYPVEMLNLGMGMDADLGIDSIKRVEIMAALRSRLPEAPEIKPEHLGALQTLEQVVAFLAAGAAGRSVAAPAAGSAATPATVRAGNAGIKSVLLEVIAEKTGYPVEMLDLGMGMDSDLGIDSIKRVEIMAALRSKLPQSPEIKPEHLGSLQTLQQIVDFLDAGAEVVSPAANPGAAQAGVAAAGRISELLLAVIAEKTGYPVEMLNLDMGLDSDLGIDSIKRVEIMAALRSALPGSPEIKPEHLGALQTLRQIVDFLAGIAGAPVAAAEVAEAVIAAPAAAPELARDNDSKGSQAAQLEVMRQVVRTVEIASGEHRQGLALPRGAHVWLVDDGSDLSGRVEERLRAMSLVVHRGGLHEKSIDKAFTTAALPAAVLVLAPAAGSDDTFLQRAFLLIQRAGPGLRKTGGAGTALLATVSRLDGAFGFGAMGGNADPVSGGLAGMLKTARREWPEVHCKAIDLDAGSLPCAEAAAQIVDEMFREGPVEVGLSARARITLEVDFELLEQLAPVAGKVAPMRLDQGDVVVISGGARGVTGDAALALARAFRPMLVLLGRSQLADSEPAWMQGLQAEAEIKKALFVNLPRGSSPAAVETHYRQLLAQREIRAQLERLAAAGARAVYHAVDVRDGAAVKRVLAEVRQRHGAIRGLVHGAGVLADRRIEDKTAEQFDSVYATKVTGLQNLLAALAPEDLKVIALFSSYTGRFGRIGQVDYAAANEVLNKLAQQASRRRPDCRVVSINWGPWNGGMVTPGLRKVFEQEGVGLIEPAAGAEFLRREICAPANAGVEVLALASAPLLVRPPASRPDRGPGAGAKKLSVAFEREVSVKALPCLESHVFNGRAVLPAALMVEWLAQAALHGNPGMRFHGLDDFKVLKGVTLDAGQSVTVSLQIGAGTPHDHLHVLPVRMVSHSGGREIFHAQADVLLTEEKLPLAPAADVVDISGGGIADAYSLGVLFHGAALHGIERVEVIAERGVAALLKAASAPIKWMSNPLRGTWIADPLALDSAFQMMILWSSAHRGGPSLPSAFARYRQFVGAFPNGGCRAVIGVALGISAIATATIQFLDHKGNLLASAEGCEFVVDAALRDAFRLNRLKLEK